jgi:rRNA-processing protein EBP2
VRWIYPEPEYGLTPPSYKLALDQIPVARKMAAKHDIPFSRPSDYYAEMVKSDEHMERVRTKLVEEA